jgi:hypothetical protein
MGLEKGCRLSCSRGCGCAALRVVLRGQDTLRLSQIVVRKCPTQTIPPPLSSLPRLFLGYCGWKIAVLATSTVFQLHGRGQGSRGKELMSLIWFDECPSGCSEAATCFLAENVGGCRTGVMSSPPCRVCVPFPTGTSRHFAHWTCYISFLQH